MAENRSKSTVHDETCRSEAGDHFLFAQIFSEHEELVKQYCQARCTRKERGALIHEDLVNEVFLCLWRMTIDRRIEHVSKDKQHLRAVVLRVAQSRIKDYRRYCNCLKRVVPERAHHASNLQVTCIQESVDTAMAFEDHWDEFLASLSVFDREVIRMRQLGLTIHQIAFTQHTSSRTIQRRLKLVYDAWASACECHE